MRKINKLTPLPHFNGNNYNGNCRIWEKKDGHITFHGNYHDIYEDTRWKILVDEQNQLCGYTELYIENFEESHIDHYKKRDHFSNLTFDWDNLIVATRDNNFGANYKDNIYKINKNEYSLIFNPVTDNVENHFYYNELGIIREDEDKVKKTIEVFNLNNNYLKARRKSIITMINNYKNSGLSTNEIREILIGSGFKSVVEQYCT